MRNTTLFAVVLALAIACTFENPINWDGLVFAVPDGVDGCIDDVPEDVVNGEADLQRAELPVDQLDQRQADVFDTQDAQDAKDAWDTEEVANPCPEGEYPDQKLMKCLKYPCCEIGGPWMLQMAEAGGKHYEYAVVIEQEKAIVVLSVLGRAPGNIELPETVSGTLETDVLHIDGGDPGITGFLMMDAKKVEKQLFEDNKITGSYKLVINGEPTHSGPWTLTPN